MLAKILILIFCAAAAALTFRGEWILKNIFKKSDPSEKAVISMKLIALLIAVILFILAFRV
ncbi:MAG: hypothetical protein LIO59_02265 [Oscillospiraceae bacterium]|nr:hypothetical protein [Oscillospiraceae bacterium]